MALYEGTTALCSNLYVNYNNSQYNLLQIHFHSPSEHTIGGGYFDAEVHLVHKNAVTGKLLVVGVLLEATAIKYTTPSNNTFLNTLWTAGGTSTLAGSSVLVQSSSNLMLSPYETFLPARPTHYSYNGSLTVPPCSEPVTWLLYDEPVRMSQSDYFMLRSASAVLKTNVLSASGNSNRYPTMPRNNRVVYYIGGGMQSSLTACTSLCDQDDTTRVNDDDNDDSADGGSSRRLGIVALAVAIMSMTLSVFLSFGLYKTKQDLNIALAKLSPVPGSHEMTTINELSKDNRIQTNA